MDARMFQLQKEIDALTKRIDRMEKWGKYYYDAHEARLDKLESAHMCDKCNGTGFITKEK